MNTSRRGFLRSLLGLPALLVLPGVAIMPGKAPPKVVVGARRWVNRGFRLYRPLSIKAEGIPCKWVEYERIYVDHDNLEHCEGPISIKTWNDIRSYYKHCQPEVTR